MFNFAENKIYLSKKFWLYWALTIPLTTIVIIIWLIWTDVKRKKRGNKTSIIKENDEENSSV
jgi:cytochrome c-type biogenesis protein CcmH/NrfF